MQNTKVDGHQANQASGFRPTALPARQIRVMGKVCLCAVISTLLATSVAWAQSRSELGNLVFEAELLTGDPAQSALTSGDGLEGELKGELEGELEGEPEGGFESSVDNSTLSDVSDSDTDTREQRASLEQTINQYKTSINTLAETGSPYSEALREQNLALAQLQQQDTDHESAISTLETAMHIDRVNHGLFTIRQIELVNLLLISHAALGHHDEVADYHEYLFYIQRKSFTPDDPRLLAATETWADWNVSSYLKDGPTSQFANPATFSSSITNTNSSNYVAVQNPITGVVMMVPRNNMNNFLNPNGANTNAAITDLSLRSSPFAVNADTMIDERLKRAEKMYEELLEDDTAQHDLQRQLALQYKLANIAFAKKLFMDDLTRSTQPGSMNYNRVMAPKPTSALVSRAYIDNKEALESLIMKLEEEPGVDPRVIANAYLNLGDWHLGFDRLRRASDAYKAAWELIQPVSSGSETMPVNPLLNPRIIQPVPAFAIHPYSRAFMGIPNDEQLDYRGYIDISLTLDKNGAVKRENIRATSPGTSQTLRSALLDYLRDNRMRPIIRNGETVTVEDLNLRFYYSY